MIKNVCAGGDFNLQKYLVHDTKNTLHINANQGSQDRQNLLRITKWKYN